MKNDLINKIYISNIDKDQRLDNFLITKFKFLPKSKIYSLIRKGIIRVNNHRKKFFYKLNINDFIKIPYFLINKHKLNINIIYKNNFVKDIIYQDDYIIIINKKYGIPVHGGTNINNGIIENLKLFYNSKNKFIELIHRIDKDTSGILLLAKNKFILKIFHKLFRNKMIYKEYITLVHGRWINNNNYYNKKIPYYLYKNKNVKNFFIKKPLFNNIYILKYYNNYTLLKIIPKTGIKHQIRIFTAIYGNPIILDKHYGNFYSDKKFNKKYKLNRMFLHFRKIKFIHPITKKKIIIKISLDKALKKCLNKLN